MLTIKGVAIHKPASELIEKARFTYKGPYIANKGRADAIEDLARHIGDDIWYIPRGLIAYDPAIQIRLPLPKLPCPVPQVRPEFPAFPNQKIVIKDLWNNYFRHEWAGRTLVYTTGGGKTYVGVRLALFRNTPTCIIEPNKELVRQTHKEIKRYTTCEIISTHASSLGKDYKPVDGTYFTVMCIDSALKRPRSFYEQFGMVIFDEVHKYCQHQRAKIFTLAASRWMLAMTASPDERSDARDPVYKLMVGPITQAEELPGFDHEEVVFHGTVHVIYYDTPEEYRGGLVEVKGTKSVTRTIAERLLPDDRRNNMILNWAEWMCAIPNMCIFVFACRRDILTKVYHMAVKRESPHFRDITLMTSSSTKEEVQKAAETSNIIFAIESIFDTGISIAKQKGIIWLTPHRSGTKQRVGRITRRDGDPLQARYIIDPVDRGIYTFVDQYKSKKEDRPCRYNEYMARGFTIVKADEVPPPITGDYHGLNKSEVVV